VIKTDLKILIPITLCILAPIRSAQAAPTQNSAVDYVKLGQKQFSQANFKEAASSFRLAIYQGAKTASVWLYLGESYDRSGEKSAARQTYQTIQKYFPNTPESARATEQLSKLPADAQSQLASATPADTAKAAQDKPVEKRKSLKNRIFVIPPQFGHTPVDPNTISTIRSLVKALPKPVYKILDQGGTNIYITPNLIDKFPKTVGVINENLGCYFSKERGRTYGREVYMCERTGAGDGSGTQLNPIMSEEDMKGFFYTFLSHALNDCLEVPSNDRQFVAMYKQDYANLDTSDPNLHAFIAPTEGMHDTFAALCASIMGSTNPTNEFCSQKFPRCRAWIVDRLKLLSDQIPDQ
jgi:hypothetical protein